MIKYHRMTLLEREKIYELFKANKNQTFIAKQLGRNKSSINREIARCSSDPIGYIPDRANLANGVIALLKECWSPEQILGRMKLENKGISVVSHETIYKVHL